MALHDLDPRQADYLSAREATRLLDIKLQTLYSYVSRGLIRSIGQPGSKARLYLRADVERVHARAVARSGHGPAAAEAMNHGQPIIDTAITEIGELGPSYRGRLAVELARSAASFESVAELLWTGVLGERLLCWAIPAITGEPRRQLDQLIRSSQRTQLLDVLALAVLQLGLQRRRAVTGVEDEARQIIGMLSACCGLVGPQRCYVPLVRGDAVATGLLRALGCPVEDATLAAINTMLVLLADHELSPGTLVARVAASGGATLHGCIAAALTASSGLNVAHVFDQVDDFLASGRGRASWSRQAMARLAQGQGMPGFVHPVYPRGDPRGRLLIEFIRSRMPRPALLAVCDFIGDVEQRTGLHVRHELPMVAICRDLGLPREAPAAIFLVARVAGWVAHIQEQRQTGQLLRPRARFVAPTVTGSLHDQS